MNTSINGNHNSAKNGAYNNSNKDHHNNHDNNNDRSLINRKLPKELLLRIFSYLDVVTLCRCAQVSKVSGFFKFFNLIIYKIPILLLG